MNRSPKSILNPAFKYTPAVATDVGKRFREIRDQQRREQGDTQTHLDEFTKRRLIALHANDPRS